ncbi:hypothetical protein OF83DRAFT_1163171 [Amylostereum chailletii]|nr:hypothetical protein OF83DRAFT_1163171 [Amylostereum chailletii]
MPLVLPAVIANSSRPRHPFVLLESSVVQSSLPILRAIVNRPDATGHLLLFCFLYPPSSLVNDPARLQAENLHVYDKTGDVPGYSENWTDPTRSAPISALLQKTYTFVSELLTLIRARPSPSRLILHLTSPTPLLTLLLSPRLSPSLTHITAHPPTLLAHLAHTQFTPPPPHTSPERFWSVFSPLASRAWEVERIVYGPGGVGSGGGHDEGVFEVLVRGPGTGEGKRRGAERLLEGWTRSCGVCELTELKSLSSVWTRKPPVDEAAPDPTQNISFNLSLTPGQQQSRAQVPLPYAHEGMDLPSPHPTQNAPGAIFYDPDSADDMDDDDPDEDLDL